MHDDLAERLRVAADRWRELRERASSDIGPNLNLILDARSDAALVGIDAEGWGFIIATFDDRLKEHSRSRGDAELFLYAVRNDVAGLLDEARARLMAPAGPGAAAGGGDADHAGLVATRE
jgi:hypothetical protein